MAAGAQLSVRNTATGKVHNSFMLRLKANSCCSVHSRSNQLSGSQGLRLCRRLYKLRDDVCLRFFCWLIHSGSPLLHPWNLSERCVLKRRCRVFHSAGAIADMNEWPVVKPGELYGGEKELLPGREFAGSRDEKESSGRPQHGAAQSSSLLSRLCG